MGEDEEFVQNCSRTVSKEGSVLETSSLGGRKVVKLILKKLYMRMWTGFFSAGSSGWFLWTR